jgi:outer membrane biosynthesis protein TonB
MGTSLSIYKKKTQFGMNNLPESLAKLGTQSTNSKQVPDTSGKEEINIKAKPEAEPEAEPKAEPEAEPKSEPEAEPKSEPEAEPKAEPKSEPEAEPKAEPKSEPEAEPIQMVTNPEKSTINKNNQKLLMYDEPHLEEDEMSNTENDILEVNEFSMVPYPEKSTISKNNEQLLRFDTDNQLDILTEININKNSTLNSGNKNLLLY